MLSTRYPIPVPVMMSYGRRRATVHVPCEPRDAAKLTEISMSMRRDGWLGRPVILADAGDHVIALTGSHRLVAAAATQITICALWLPEDLTDDDWNLIDSANDDDDLLAALEEINIDRGGDMDHIVARMMGEVEHNRLAP